MANELSKQYRLMIYFAVATMHFYRSDIIPLSERETLGSFHEKNKKVMDRVCEEAINIFNYELSSEQIGRAIAAYVSMPRLLKIAEIMSL